MLGIRNALFGAFAADELRPDIGAVWENWVIVEMAKYNALLTNYTGIFVKSALDLFRLSIEKKAL